MWFGGSRFEVFLLDGVQWQIYVCVCVCVCEKRYYLPKIAI